MHGQTSHTGNTTKNRTSTLCALFCWGVSSILSSQNKHTKTTHTFLFAIYQSINMYIYININILHISTWIFQTNLCFIPLHPVLTFSGKKNINTKTTKITPKEPPSRSFGIQGSTPPTTNMTMDVSPIKNGDVPLPGSFSEGVIPTNFLPPTSHQQIGPRNEVPKCQDESDESSSEFPPLVSEYGPWLPVIVGEGKKELYCWWFRNPVNSPVEVSNWNPIIYMVLYIPGGAGFLPSAVGWMELVNICWGLFLHLISAYVIRR